MKGQIFLITSVATGECVVESCQNQGYLARIGGAEKVGVFTVAGLRQAHGLEFPGRTSNNVGRRSYLFLQVGGILFFFR